MCNDRYVVEEKQVGGLTVRVYHDDTDCGRWRETQESAKDANLLWVPDATKIQRSGDLAPRARFASLDPMFTDDEISSEIAYWYDCDYRCGDGTYCRDCQDREYRNELLATHYFFETGYVGDSNGWLVGEKTDFKDLESFEEACNSIVAEYKHLERGEVYGYEVTDEDGDHLDSCWGFIGEIDYCLSQGVEAAEYIETKRAETAFIVEPYEAIGNGD